MHDDLYPMPTISVMMKALQFIKALTFSVSFCVFCEVTKCLCKAVAITSHIVSYIGFLHTFLKISRTFARLLML